MRPDIVSTIVLEDPTNVTTFAFRISRFSMFCSIDISTIEGGFFKRKSPEDGTSASHLELGFLQSGTHFGGNCLLRGDGPNGISGILCHIW
jgi:hypothetical protein